MTIRILQFEIQFINIICFPSFTHFFFPQSVGPGSFIQLLFRHIRLYLCRLLLILSSVRFDILLRSLFFFCNASSLDKAFAIALKRYQTFPKLKGGNFEIWECFKIEVKWLWDFVFSFSFVSSFKASTCFCCSLILIKNIKVPGGNGAERGREVNVWGWMGGWRIRGKRRKENSPSDVR